MIPFFAALLVGLTGAGVAYYNAVQERNKSEHDLKTERERNDQYQRLLDHAAKTLSKTDSLLEKQGQSLKHHEETLDSAKKIIKAQDAIIKGQDALIQQQTETLNYVIGKDSFPVIKVTLLDRGSDTLRARFSVLKSGEYPLRSVQVLYRDFPNRNNAAIDGKPIHYFAGDVILEKSFCIYEFSKASIKGPYTIDFDVSWLTGYCFIKLVVDWHDELPRFRYLSCKTHSGEDYHSEAPYIQTEIMSHPEYSRRTREFANGTATDIDDYDIPESFSMAVIYESNRVLYT